MPSGEYSILYIYNNPSDQEDLLRGYHSLEDPTLYRRLRRIQAHSSSTFLVTSCEYLFFPVTTFLSPSTSSSRDSPFSHCKSKSTRLPHYACTQVDEGDEGKDNGFTVDLLCSSLMLPPRCAPYAWDLLDFLSSQHPLVKKSTFPHLCEYLIYFSATSILLLLITKLRVTRITYRIFIIITNKTNSVHQPA